MNTKTDRDEWGSFEYTAEDTFWDDGKVEHYGMLRDLKDVVLTLLEKTVMTAAEIETFWVNSFVANGGPENFDQWRSPKRYAAWLLDWAAKNGKAVAAAVAA
jgi:hypothetical protein